MKSNLLVLLAIVTLASCSSPKYAYYFDHQKNYASKKQSAPAASTEISSFEFDPNTLVASTSNQPIVLAESAPAPEVKKTYAEMSKSEKKEVRHQLKKEMKKFAAQKKNATGAAQAGMDHDLKLAIIFGAVGIVGLLIGGNVFWIIGGIALLIGVVFFVKWIIRQ